MDKNAQKNKSLYLAKLRTDLLQEQFDEGREHINKLHQVRIRESELLQLELKRQSELKAGIDEMAAESRRIEKSNRAHRKVIQRLKADNQKLEESQNEEERTHSSQTIRNSFPELILHLNRGDLPTEKSILLTCLGKFIRTMSENEFEEHDWTAKIAENRNGVGGRIRFNGLFFTETDMKIIFQPVIQELEMRFSRSALEIVTKTKKQSSVVVSVDITIKVPSKIREASLSLP